MQPSTRLCSKFTPARNPSDVIKIAPKCWPSKFKIQRKPSASFFCCILQQSTYHYPIFFTSQHFTLIPGYFYQKDERALPPGNIQSSKFLCFLLLIIINVLPLLPPPPPVLFPLSLSLSLSLFLFGISVLPFMSLSVCLISGATPRIIL